MITIDIENELHCRTCGKIISLLQQYDIIVFTPNYKLPYKIKGICKECFEELTNNPYAKKS